jgi:hypothetical protein
MISQIVEVLTKLIEVIERFQRSQIEKDQSIESYLRKIEQCLQKSVEDLEAGQAPDKWVELRIHAKDLSKYIGAVIGEIEANNLSNQLVDLLNEPPEVGTDLKPLKKLISSIRVHADRIALPKSPKSFINRRTLIYSTLGASSAFAVGWFGNRQTSSVNWKMVSVFGENTRKLILPKVPQIICDRVKEMTNGNFVIEIDIEIE